MKMFAFALLLAFACTSQQAVAPPSGQIVVTGTITDEGAECLAMRGDDGKLYTLGKPDPAPAPGTRVRVTGTVAEMSHCMQGITINVTKLETLPR